MSSAESARWPEALRLGWRHVTCTGWKGERFGGHHRSIYHCSPDSFYIYSFRPSSQLGRQKETTGRKGETICTITVLSDTTRFPPRRPVGTMSTAVDGSAEPRNVSFLQIWAISDPFIFPNKSISLFLLYDRLSLVIHFLQQPTNLYNNK